MIASLFFLVFACNVFAWKPQQTYRGIVYNPIPKGVDPLNSQNDFLVDLDVYNSDFVALWGVDHDHPDVVSRNDLKKLREDGFNSLHIENWNPQNRDHIPFLDYCEELGLKVFVPIGNDVFLSTYRHQMTETIIDSTRDAQGQIHAAVAGWLIADNYRAQHIPILDLVDIMEYIHTTLDPPTSVDDHNRPFGIRDDSYTSYNEDLTNGRGISTVQSLYDNLDEDIFINRLIYCLNDAGGAADIGQFLQEALLDPYVALFASNLDGLDPIPFMITKFNINPLQYIHGEEEGMPAVDEDQADTDAWRYLNETLLLLKEWIIDEPETNVFNVVGFFLFEFTNEYWKYSYLQGYGMHELGDSISPILATTVNWAAGVEYPVEELIPHPAYISYIADLKEFISPEELQQIIGKEIDTAICNISQENVDNAFFLDRDTGLCREERIICDIYGGCNHVIDASWCILPGDVLDGPEKCWVEAGFIVPTEYDEVSLTLDFDTWRNVTTCVQTVWKLCSDEIEAAQELVVEEMVPEEMVAEETAAGEEFNTEEVIFVEEVLSEEMVSEEAAAGEEFNNEEIIHAGEIPAVDEEMNIEATVEEIVTEEAPVEQDIVCDSDMSLTDLLQLVCDLQLRVNQLETDRAAFVNVSSSTTWANFMIPLLTVSVVLLLMACAWLVRNRKRRERSATDIELYHQLTG